MQRKLYLALFIAAFVPFLVFASGKIRGKVTDAGTGEPLVGANVVVVGSQMGAATNVSGEFVILNVPAGTYALKTSYVGFQAITLSNLRVNNDLTLDANFQLPAEGVTVGTVEIVAERPLVNKSATNAVRIIDQEFFDKIPARGTMAAIATQPGVIIQGVNPTTGTPQVFVRGGRPDEVGFRVEGVGTTNILYGGSAVNVAAEAVEQIQIQAGGFNAEYGGANAGIIQSQLRNGSPDRWKVSVLGESDRYAKYGTKSLGGYSYGYSDFTATFGGPINLMGTSKIRFFGSLENTFLRDPSLSVRSPFNFVVATDAGLTAAHPTDATAKSDTITLARGANAVGGSDNRWSGSGTLFFDFTPVQVRVAGSYSTDKSQAQAVIASLLDQNRLQVNKENDGFLNVRLSHMLSPTLFYEANFNYFSSFTQGQDPDFGNNIAAYGDLAANAKLGYQLYRQGLNFPNYSLYGGYFSINQPGAQIALYQVTKQMSLGGKVDMTAQLKSHEVKFGGEFTQYKIRRYAPSLPLNWASVIQKDGGNLAQQEIDLMRLNIGADNYGYDIYGRTLESDDIRYDAAGKGYYYNFAPRKPVFGAVYVQDKIEFSDVILNLGLRYDYINPDSFDAPDPGNIALDKNGFMAVSSLMKTDKTSQVSPRIGLSFPVTDRTVFHLQFGKFIQQTQLRDSYQGAARVGSYLSQAGLFIQTPFGWGLKPTRTTQYEAGFAQQISDVASFDITAFYKDIQDQIQWTNVVPTAGSQDQNYGALINADFSTSKGVEVKFTLRRTNRLLLSLNYTFSDVRSTGSNSSNTSGLWSAGSVVAIPHYIFPADFNVAHQGSVILDYRFAKGDGGPVLEQLGVNLLASFNSGHSFTKLVIPSQFNIGDPRFRYPVGPIGSATTPWFFELDMRLDKTFRVGSFDLNPYIYVINLLGTDNPLTGFVRTGDAGNDGWLASAEGSTSALQNGPQYAAMWQAINNGENSGNWGPPRQIRFGIRVDY